MHSSNASETIQAAGFRATKQRVALVSFLENSHHPLLAQEIADGLKKRMDPVTTYRMLAAFKRADLVREVNLRGEHPRYELRDERDHHHIVCTNCGHIEDFTEATHENLEKRVLSKSNSFKKITGHSLDLYGVCNGCEK